MSDNSKNKYYFVREQRAAIMADDEESARAQLEEFYGEDTEDFILDDVKPMILLGVEWVVAK